MAFSFDIYTYADHHHEQLPHQLPSQTHWVAAMFAKLVGVEEDNTGLHNIKSQKNSYERPYKGLPSMLV